MMIAFTCLENSQKFHAVKRLPRAIATAKKTVGADLQNFGSLQEFLRYARTLNEIVEIYPVDRVADFKLQELCRDFHETQHRAGILRLEKIAEAERKRNYWLKRVSKDSRILAVRAAGHPDSPGLVERIAKSEKHAEKWGHIATELEKQ